MKTYTEQELQDAVLEAKVEENIHWLSRAHFMAYRKHEERINYLVKKYKPIDPDNHSVYTEGTKQG